MPSQLYDNEGVTFVCARSFTYNGQDYTIGADFPQEDLVDSPEVLVRSRYLIPVVESWENKPRHWHREIQLKENVLRKLGHTGETLLNKEPRVAAPVDGDAPEGDDEAQDTPAETEENSPIPNEQVSTEEETSDEENVSEEASEETSSEPEEETTEEETPEVENEIKEFDPKDYTNAEVNEYLAQDDITIDEYNRVVELEMDGKARSGILNEHSVITEDE